MKAKTDQHLCLRHSQPHHLNEKIRVDILILFENLKFYEKSYSVAIALITL